MGEGALQEVLEGDEGFPTILEQQRAILPKKANLGLLFVFIHFGRQIQLAAFGQLAHECADSGLRVLRPFGDGLRLWAGRSARASFGWLQQDRD